MKRHYFYAHQIDDEGFKAVSFNGYTFEERMKADYVNRPLDKSIAEAQCGWAGVAYRVLKSNGMGRREFVLMFANKDDVPRYARWIDVTGESRGSIAEAVWSLVFA